MSQYIFLDESGDLGFNPKKRNSQFFVITILFAKDKKPLEKVVKKVHQLLRKKVKKLSGGVLHAVKERPHTRKKLLKLLVERNCVIMTIYLNKAKVYTHLKNEKHVLYNYVTNILLDRIMKKKILNINSPIILVAARRETNKFLNENFTNYLKQQVKTNHKSLIQIVIKSPSGEKTLQAVDFVSWSIFRKYEFKDKTYYEIIKECIIEENALFP